MKIDEARWAALMRGEGCPFCTRQPDVNEFSLKVADLSVSTLWLERDQRFRGYCVLVYGRHVTELTRLSPSETLAYHADLLRAAGAIERALHPDKMNYLLLGNTVPHLHWHIVPRFKDDPRWNEPHYADWDRHRELAVRLREDEYRALIETIRRELD